MDIRDFVILVDQQWHLQRGLTPAHGPIEQINLSPTLFQEMFNLCSVIGWGHFQFRGITIKDEFGLAGEEVTFLYDSKTNDCQDFDFGLFRTLPFANARVAINTPIVLGSAKLSGTNQYPYTFAPQLIYPGNYTPAPFVSSLSDHPINDTHAPKGCNHQWKKYQGFHLENFDYCTVCDVKKE